MFRTAFFITPVKCILGGGNSNIFSDFQPYLGKISNFTSIFFKGVGSTTNQIYFRNCTLRKKIKHDNGKSPFSVGNTSLNGVYSIVMLVFRGVIICPAWWFDSALNLAALLQGSSWCGHSVPLHRLRGRHWGQRWGQGLALRVYN